MTRRGKIGKAMAAAVDRVNEGSAESALLEENEALKARVRGLERLLARTLVSEQHLVNGRPAITLAQAARQRGVTYYTARRRCEDGTWDALYVQGDAHRTGARKYGRWWVYVDDAGVPADREAA